MVKRQSILFTEYNFFATSTWICRLEQEKTGKPFTWTADCITGSCDSRVIYARDLCSTAARFRALGPTGFTWNPREGK